ncbi:putative toxin-antitoxin system toxin component, PIN family [Aquabacterium sp.]|uniref:putative toxin-antitoxin system toxin component, PIN family n=1 Tax=Aquabacterium sp. TaxID=1872578 RepID=UPI0025C2B071|nr:putative toxin-antitoxin system toxin component, PIN family [Aquabacterium sp.]
MEGHAKARDRVGGREGSQLFTSRVLLDELAATLGKKKLAKYVAATGFTADQLLANYRRIATMVTARQLDTQVSRDADDDAVLACALAARADLIVSGDDLLVLKDLAYPSSPPLRPSRASLARPSLR